MSVEIMSNTSYKVTPDPFYVLDKDIKASLLEGNGSRLESIRALVDKVKIPYGITVADSAYIIDKARESYQHVWTLVEGKSYCAYCQHYVVQLNGSTNWICLVRMARIEIEENDGGS